VYFSKLKSWLVDVLLQANRVMDYIEVSCRGIFLYTHDIISTVIDFLAQRKFLRFLKKGFLYTKTVEFNNFVLNE